MANFMFPLIRLRVKSSTRASLSGDDRKPSAVSINSTSGEVFDSTALDTASSSAARFPLIRLRVKSSTALDTQQNPVLEAAVSINSTSGEVFDAKAANVPSVVAVYFNLVDG